MGCDGAGERSSPGGREAMKNLVLLGMMGTGKSTVAAIIAERLGRVHVDTDSEIERIAGKSIPAIFSEQGEPAFRRLERLAVDHVARRSDQVVSVGGERY